MNVRNQKEQFLLHRIRRSQDQVAFAELIIPYTSATYRLLRGKLPTKEDADDAQNTTLLRTWSYLTKATEVKNVGGLIHTIARAVIAEYYRMRKPEPVPLVLGEGQEIQVEDKKALRGIVAGAEHTFVLEAMKRLKEEHREAIALRYLEGLRVRDIAARMEISEGAAHMLIHRALKALREEIE